MLIERMLLFICTEFMATSMGVLTNRSTSSAERPGQSETMIICVLVTSGKRFDGRVRVTVRAPPATSSAVMKKTKKRFFREKATMPEINLFMLRKGELEEQKTQEAILAHKPLSN